MRLYEACRFCLCSTLYRLFSMSGIFTILYSCAFIRARGTNSGNKPDRTSRAMPLLCIVLRNPSTHFTACDYIYMWAYRNQCLFQLVYVIENIGYEEGNTIESPYTSRCPTQICLLKAFSKQICVGQILDKTSRLFASFKDVNKRNVFARCLCILLVRHITIAGVDLDLLQRHLGITNGLFKICYTLSDCKWHVV